MTTAYKIALGFVRRDDETLEQAHARVRAWDARIRSQQGALL
jgi:hypothetical protein